MNQKDYIHFDFQKTKEEKEIEHNCHSLIHQASYKNYQ